jgi:L-malate glycosyltransferase
LRIVHLVSSLNMGGLEQFAVRMAHAQRKRGHDASLLTLHDGQLRADAEKLGIPIVLLGGAESESGLARLTQKVTRVGRGVLTLRRLSADIVHAHNPVTLHYAHLSKIGGSSKVVLTCHGRGKNEMKPPTPEQWRKTDAVIAVSQAVMNDTTDAHSARICQVIRNGVEPTPPQRNRGEVRAELGLSAERCVGLLAARIDHLKGHEVLLDALAILKRRGLEFTMLFAGDGKERSAREARAQELGLTPDDVRFLGFRSDIADLLGVSDIFVLPSFSEGLPLSVLEGMAQGLPIVATTVGGIPEVVTQNQEGILVPPKDADALADALAHVVQDAELRKTLGKAGKCRVADEFTFAGMLDAYDMIYKNVLGSSESALFPFSSREKQARKV